MAEVMKVAAAVVLLKVSGKVAYLYTGAEIPEGADTEQVKRLLDMGMLVKESATEPQAAPAAQGEVPDFAKMEYPALQALAKERGLAANQSREDLIKALAG